MRVSPTRGRIRSAFLLILGAIAVGLGLYSLAGVYGGPWLVDRWLEEYRTAAPGRTASRAMVRFNPFTLVGEIVDVAVRDPESGAAFAADRIVVDFAARSLAERRPAISSIVIERPRLDFASAADLAEFAHAARDTALDRARIGHLEVTGGALAAGTDADPDSAFGFSRLDLSLRGFDGVTREAGQLRLDAATTTGAILSIDGSLNTDLEQAEGRLQLDELELETLGARLGGVIDAAELSGRMALAAGFSAQSLLGTPTLQITDARVGLSDLSLNAASGLTVSVDDTLADGGLVLAASDEDFDLSGRIEINSTRVMFRDTRATTPQSFVLDDAAAVATTDDDGLSLILGGRLLQAGDAALTVRVLPGAAARSISIEASALPTTTLSAYAFDAVGRRLATGSAELSLDYSLTADRADGSLHLTMRELAFAPDAAGDRVDSASLELAAALLEDADGIIDLDLRFATTTGTVRDALADALAARIAAVTETPFDTLAILTEGEDQPDDAVPFLPGDAALGDRALALVRALADALNARPRLGIRVYGGYDATVDRDALARNQIELHVTLATAGASPQARAAPVNFSSPRAQDVLDEFAGERLPANRVAALAERFVCEGALADVCERVYYEQIFDALVANEEIGPTVLRRLGRFRAQSIVDALRQRGIADERIEIVTGDNVVETPFGIGLPVELTALETATQASAP